MYEAMTQRGDCSSVETLLIVFENLGFNGVLINYIFSYCVGGRMLKVGVWCHVRVQSFVCCRRMFEKMPRIAPFRMVERRMLDRR